MVRLSLLLFCLFLQPIVAQAQAQAQAVKFMVVEGVQLEYLDIGNGTTTLVVESGVGMGIAYWQPLFADFAKLDLRTIVYSRAGNGQSGAVTDVSLAASTKRLAKLLTALGINENLILLGHSYGGLHVRAFAATYPSRVKGLLLLDPSHERFDAELNRYDAAWSQRDTAKVNQMMAGHAEWQNLQAIYRGKNINDGDVANKMPTVIVTSAKLNESDWWIGHSAEGKKIWRNLHQSLICNNANSIHVVTNKTGHNMPQENKNLLFSAVDSILELTRGF